MSSKKYSLKGVRKDLLLKWDGDDFYLLAYYPRSSSKANETTDLILDFKNGVKEAIDTVNGLAAEAVAGIERYLRFDCNCRYIVSIPPHAAGQVSTSVESVCSTLYRRFRWLTHLRGALQRTATVKKAAYARPGMRPTYDDHIRTISYKGPALKSPSGVVLLDDVITTKASSEACRHILEAQGAAVVKGIYFGRTVR